MAEWLREGLGGGEDGGGGFVGNTYSVYCVAGSAVLTRNTLLLPPGSTFPQVYNNLFLFFLSPCVSVGAVLRVYL